MQTLKLKVSLFLNYFVFAILLNSVGTVILQVQGNFGITKGAASVLEAFKDFSIAGTSFIVASFIVRIGYKNAMLIAMALVTAVCLVMPNVPSFLMTKLLFASVGFGFALIKVSVFATLGLVTKNEKDHLSLMNFLESFFMVGILLGNFLFSYFVDNDNVKSQSWLQVYYVLAGLSGVALLLLFTTKIDESQVKKAENEITKSNTAGFSGKMKSIVKEFLEMLKLTTIPLVLVFIFSVFFYVLIEQSIMSWLPTFNKDVLHLSTSLAIQMASILSASFALGRFLAGIVFKKMEWLYVLLGCLAIAAAIVLITVPLTRGLAVGTISSIWDVPFVAFAFPLIGLFLAPIYPAINSVILSQLPKHKHAAMTGLIVVFSALGGTTGSIITGHIFGSYGGQTAFYFSLAPIAIMMLLLFAFKRMQSKSNQDKTINIAGGGGH